MTNLVKNPFARIKNSFAPSKIVGKNPYSQSSKATETLGEYENASEMLRHKTYVERNKSLFSFVTKARNIYPFISVVLAVFVCIKASEIFTNGLEGVGFWIVSVLITLLTFMIVVGVEKLKISGLRDYFHAIACGDNTQPKTVVTLVFALILSLVISSYGGFLISSSVSDKSTEITTDFDSKRDSLNQIYSSQIEPHQLIIASAKEVLAKKKTGWRANVAKSDLANASKEIAVLREAQKSELATISDTKILALTNDGDNVFLYAGGAALLVVIFELFYAFSYRFEYEYYKNAKKEDANHKILKGAYKNENANSQDEQSQLSTLLALLAHHATNGTQIIDNAIDSVINPSQTVDNPLNPVSQHSQIVGFQLPKSNNTDSVPKIPNANRYEKGKGFLIVCKNCSKQTHKKHSQAKYCSDSCRSAYHGRRKPH